MKKNHQNNKQKFHFDFGIFLLVTGALSNVTLWIGAFVSTEAQGAISLWVREIFLPILGGISGLAMGVTVAAGLVYVIARLNDMKPVIERKVRGKDEVKSTPNLRFYMAWSAVVVLMVISPVLLGPYVYMLLSGEQSLFAVLGSWWSGAWSVGRIVAADLAMGAVALVQGVHVGASAVAAPATGTATGAKTSGAPAKPTTKSAKANATSAANMKTCEVAGCGIAYRWPQGKGAHLKKHHPDLVIRKAIPVGYQVENEVKTEKKA